MPDNPLAVLGLIKEAIRVAPQPLIVGEEPLLHLQSLHLADGQPQIHENRWLNPAVLPDPAPDFAAISANEWLVSNLSYLLGDIAFSAENASAEEAAALGVAPGAALFITERCTWGDQPITWVRLAHAPGYRLQTML